MTKSEREAYRHQDVTIEGVRSKLPHPDTLNTKLEYQVLWNNECRRQLADTQAEGLTETAKKLKKIMR